MVEFSKMLTRRETKHVSDAMSGMLSAIGDPETITLGGGAPAAAGFPVDEFRELMNELMRNDARGIEMMQYGQAMGVPDLRTVCAEQLLPEYNVNVDMDNIMITNGGIEIMGMVCDMFLDPGDVVLVESPTFVQSVLSFSVRGAKCVPCAMDDNGLVIEDVEEKIKNHAPKIIYTIPNFQNPTGRTMPEKRRRRLAELAETYDVMILEDDPYRDIRFRGEPVRSIKSFDKTGNVIMANSFSKIFSPGCRLGYVVADDPVMEKMVTLKQANSTHAAVPQQVICAEYFKRGYFPEHLKSLRETYKANCDVMLECIKTYFPADAKHTESEGGLFTWVELQSERIDTDEMLKEAVQKRKVDYIAGSVFYAEGGKGKNCMRLSFSAETPERIERGVRALGELIKEKLNS